MIHRRTTLTGLVSIAGAYRRPGYDPLRLCVLAVGVSLGLAAITPASAIVGRHDRPPERYLANPEEYAQVIDLDNVGATLVAPQWMITAAHAVEDMEDQPLTEWSVQIGGRTIPYDKVVIHPRHIGHSVDSDFDLALVHLTHPVAIAPAPLYEWTDEPDHVGTIVGRGGSGVGSQSMNALARDNRLRVASNHVEAVFEHSIVTTFSIPPDGEDLEGAPGLGDSGGPLFIEREGVRYLAGVISFNASEADHPLYGSLHAYARISTHRDWIEATIARSDAPSSIRQWSNWERAGARMFPATPAAHLASVLLEALSHPGIARIQAFYQQHGSLTSATPLQIRAQRMRDALPATTYQRLGYKTLGDDRFAVLLRDGRRRLICLQINSGAADNQRASLMATTTLTTLPFR